MRRPGDYLTFSLLATAAWAVAFWNGYGWWHAPPAQRATVPTAAAGGCLSAEQKKALGHGVAKRTLPANWLIQAGDIAWGGHPVVSEQYLRCAVTAGDPVVDQDLANEPIVTAGVGKTIFLLPPPATPDVNAGMQVELFDNAGPAVASGVPVVAVKSGMTFLEVTPDQAQVLERAIRRLRAVRQK